MYIGTLIKNQRLVSNVISIILIVLICSFVFYLKIYAISLSDLDEVAENEVKKEIESSIRQQVEWYYPNLTPLQREKIISKEIKHYFKTNEHGIKYKIKERAQLKKSFYQNQFKHTYMFGIDSYYWLRLTNNLIEKGHIGDRLIGKINYDDLVDVPIEESLERSLHLWLGKFIYSALKYLKIDLDKDIGLYIIPVFFSLLLVIFSFLITKYFSQSNTAAFFASLAVNLSPMLLQRVGGEWFDTDIYSVFFPLVIFGAFIFVFRESSYKKRTLGLSLFVLLTMIYSGIWQGWWFIFDILLIGGGIYFLLEGCDFKELYSKLRWLFCLFIFTFIAIWFFTGKQNALNFFIAPKDLIFALKDVPRDNWPNVFLTVAELRSITPYQLAVELGGVVVFFVAIIGALYFILHEKIIRDRKNGLGYFVISIWLGFLYYLALNAIRFSILLIVPLGILFGLSIDIFIKKCLKMSHNYSKIIHFFTLGVVIIMVYFVVAFFSKRAYYISLYKRPMINDAWYNAISYIRDNSSAQSHINSWWDYGHWFTAIGKRRVLFDGKTQNSPIAYWMAKFLITDDEEEALGILRMLNLSGNKAFDMLENSFGIPHFKAVTILKDLTKINNKQRAERYLSKYLTAEQIKSIIPLLYAEKMPEVYFIASYDIVAKIPAISLIGNWDFQKGDIWLSFTTKTIPEFVNYLSSVHQIKKEDITNYIDMLQYINKKEARNWISRSFIIDYRSLTGYFKKEDNLMLFDNDIVLDLDKKKVFRLRGQNKEIGIPRSLVFLDDDGNLKEFTYSDANVVYSVLLFKEGKENYKTILMDPELTKSMFIRMYYFRGNGLKYFSLIDTEETEGGNYIFVYKVNWPDFFQSLATMKPYYPLTEN